MHKEKVLRMNTFAWLIKFFLEYNPFENPPEFITDPFYLYFNLNSIKINPS